MGERAHVRDAPRPKPRRPDVQLHRRPDHGQQPDGRPPRVGPHAEGHLAALRGDAGLRPLLPERLRLPGPVGRGRRREGARPQLQARDRGVRPGAVRARLPRSRRALLGPAHRALQAARAVDGLGAVVLHDDRPQHLLHLGLPPGLQRARLALQGPPLDAVVPALRDVALAARADRLLQGPDAPVAARPHAARGARPRVPGRVDDDAVDAPGERRRGRAARRRLRARRDGVRDRDRRGGEARGEPDRRKGAGDGARVRARRADLHRAVRRAPRPGQLREPGRGLGRRLDGGGDGRRPHRAGLRRGGLRARQARGPRGADPG